MNLLRAIRDFIYGEWIKQWIWAFHKRGGKIVVITGSYGKTSVKELAYDLLRQKYEAVKTSGNYNTVVGIAKTLRYEVTNHTDLLILEVGAYKAGEITYFCKILKPDIGVITGIARQHLTRFGSWENIIRAKTEIMRYIADNGGTLIANGSDETVAKVVSGAILYSGETREQINQNGAQAVARVCGMNASEIKESEKFYRPVPSRFEITTERYGMRVIDDSYNSNEKSFAQAIEYLGKQKKYTRIVVTPGLVELGSESEVIHEQLGKGLIGKADCVILVGKNERTKRLAKGIDGQVKIIYIEKTLEFMQIVKDLKFKQEPIVLLENDVPLGF
ncbi:MAG: UDP-N-acetylmuramoyl-tripeptide--D-alanyl-D-alanine ligase [Microgenomates group bacterium]